MYDIDVNKITNPRHKDIISAYLNNLSLTKTGRLFDISRQRVLQIVQLYGNKMNPVIVRQLKQEEKNRLKKERTNLRLAKHVASFWNNVKIKSNDECWEWKASKRFYGYGAFSCKNYPSSGGYAHRMSWLLTRGEISNGMCVLHDCDNPSCVNPSHLYLGTMKDNCKDREDRFYRKHPEVRSNMHKNRKKIYCSECGEPQKAKGLCEKHYLRKRRREKNQNCGLTPQI